jgi:hypothetical protein
VKFASPLTLSKPVPATVELNSIMTREYVSKSNLANFGAISADRLLTKSEEAVKLNKLFVKKFFFIEELHFIKNI